MEKNRVADNAAKLGRGHCECDGLCGRIVTEENQTEFEWDHLVQSFDDPKYVPVSTLIGRGSRFERCEEERRKCRLLYNKCHRLHSSEQSHSRRAARSRLVDRWM